MPTTLISYAVNNADWSIALANTTIRYSFIGDTAAEQYANIQVMSNLMVEYGTNIGAFAGRLGETIAIPEGGDADIVTQQLFGGSTELIYASAEGVGHTITVGGQVLIDVLEEVGESLLLFL